VIRGFVILGATGDLTSRKLLPAFARLHEVGKLPPRPGGSSSHSKPSPRMRPSGTTRWMDWPCWAGRVCSG
jgi:hypothetical protein